MLLSTRVEYEKKTAIFKKCRFKTKISGWKNCLFTMKFDDPLEIDMLTSMLNQRKLYLLRGKNEIPVYDMWREKI